MVTETVVTVVSVNMGHIMPVFVSVLLFMPSAVAVTVVTLGTVHVDVHVIVSVKGSALSQ